MGCRAPESEFPSGIQDLKKIRTQKWSMNLGVGMKENSAD
jgi:hypothetical protein